MIEENFTRFNFFFMLDPLLLINILQFFFGFQIKKISNIVLKLTYFY